MREVLSISIDKNLKESVEEAASKYHISKRELVKKAIVNYIAHEEFREIRKMAVPYAEKAGYFTDEDIFDEFS